MASASDWRSGPEAPALRPAPAGSCQAKGLGTGSGRAPPRVAARSGKVRASRAKEGGPGRAARGGRMASRDVSGVPGSVSCRKQLPRARPVPERGESPGAQQQTVPGSCEPQRQALLTQPAGACAPGPRPRAETGRSVVARTTITAIEQLRRGVALISCLSGDRLGSKVGTIRREGRFAEDRPGKGRPARSPGRRGGRPVEGRSRSGESAAAPRPSGRECSSVERRGGWMASRFGLLDGVPPVPRAGHFTVMETTAELDVAPRLSLTL